MKVQAFKEWSSLCELLLKGRIAGLFRKGGLADAPGALSGPLGEFWLHPTAFHEQRSPLREGWEVDPSTVVWGQKLSPDQIPLPAWCVTTGCYHIQDLASALILAQNSPWTDQVIETRFRYRAPGIYFHTLRDYRPEPLPIVADDPAWKGCKSFHEVNLSNADFNLTPVLTTVEYRQEILRIEGLLNPVAFA